LPKRHSDSIEVDVAGATHTGRVRKTNEDSFLTLHLPGSADALLAVADGVGGRKAGDIASEMAVKTLLRARLMHARQCRDADSYGLKMREAIQSANHFLFKLNHQFGNPQFATGTTLTVLVLMNSGGLVFNVGDSRCYRLRRNRLEALTHDDTWAQKLADQKKLSCADVSHHPLSNTLYRCIGSAPSVDTSMKRVNCNPRDRFLVATDGIWKVLSPDQIQLVLGDSGNAQEAVGHLILAALREGARDNLAACVAFLA